MLCPPNDSIWKFVKSFLVIAALLPMNSLLAQDIDAQSCANGLTEARNQLFLGAFDQATALIQPCIDADAYGSVEDLVQAYELLANVYIAINDEAQAREAISRLLEAAPNYQPDADQSRSDYVFLVNEMRAALKPTTPSITSIDAEDLSITINWSYTNTPEVASFSVYKGPHPDSLALLTTLQVDQLSLSTQADNSIQTSYEDSDAEYATSYYYALEAIGVNGNASTRSITEEVFTTEAQVAEVPESPQSKRKRLSPWVFVGGGVVAGGLAAILAGGGGGGDDPPGGNGGETTLGGPPPLPN